MILHLGITDIPYNRAQSRRSKRSAATITTGDVAEILEARYGIMAMFMKRHEHDVIADMENSIRGAVENVLVGAPINFELFNAGMQSVEGRFRRFIVEGEVEHSGIAGVPTQAALRGVNHRYKHPYRRRASRRSFIDTGLYVQSFKAWVDEESFEE
jgi:hypothetical protein